MKNSLKKNIFEEEKSLVVEHDFFFRKIAPNWVYFGQGEDCPKKCDIPATKPSKTAKWDNTAYVNKWNIAFKIKLCVFQVTKT